MKNLSPLAKTLLENELIDKQLLLKIIETLKDDSLLCHLAKNNFVASEKLASLASKFFGLPTIDLTQIPIAQFPDNCLNIDIISQTKSIPIKEHPTHVDIAIADPGNSSAIDTVKFQIGKPIHLFIADFQQIEDVISKMTRKSNSQSLSSLKSEKDIFDLSQPTISDLNDEPLVCFVHHTIEEAIESKASDIHFETYEQTCRIRIRRDGLLYKISEPPRNIAPRIAARLKIMARLDIAEHRIPQDGHFQLQIKNKMIDVRMSTCPTLYGEKVVLRLLNNEQKIKLIDALDFTEQQYVDFYHAINQPQGLIIVTGPTSSGKTTTLYAALQHLNHETKNILTIEDPIEINLPNINQTNINTKTNLTFARALRTFLRQDPDIIMVGEIRDLETAEIAIKAAQTGHLVLSTLHTNNAAQALTRLQNIGIEKHDIMDSLTLVTAQRLLRKLCPNCKKETTEPSQHYEPVGCKKCLGGYSGRIAVHEVLPIIKSQNSQIMSTPKSFMSLQASAIKIAHAGLTTFEEITRVIQFESDREVNCIKPN